MGGKPIFRLLASIIIGAALLVCFAGSSDLVYLPGSISITESSGDTIPADSPLIAYVGETIPIKVYVRTDTHAAEAYANISFSASIVQVIDSLLATGGSGTFWDTRTTNNPNDQVYPFLDNTTGTTVFGLVTSSSMGSITDKKMADITFLAIKPGILTIGFTKVFSVGQTISGSFPTALVKSGVSVLNSVESGVVNIQFNDTPKLSSPDTGAETNAVRPVFVFTFPDTMLPDSYEIQIDTASSFPAAFNGYYFDSPSEANAVDTETYVRSSDLAADNLYYWRVRARMNDGVVSGWADSRVLKVRKPATLDVVRIVVSSGAAVTRGQGQTAGDSIVVQVVIKNTAAVDSAGLSGGDTLVFRRARDGANVSDSFTVLRFRDTGVTNDTIIPAGSVEDTFSYYVIIKTGADTGFDTITAYFEGVDTKFNTFMADGSDSDAGDNDSFVWRVYAAAELTVLAVSITPDSVTRGQSGSDSVQVIVTVANVGENSCTVTADTLVFVYDGSGSDTASDSFFVGTRSATSTTIAGGATETFTYRFSVTDTAPLGRLAVHDTVSGLDIRIGAATHDSRAVNPDTVVVQTPARPYIGYVTSSTDTVYQGKSY